MNRYISKRYLVGFVSLLLCWAVCMAADAVAGVIYVKQGAASAGDGSSWADAYTDLQDALSEAVPGDAIWVAAGVYTPGTGRNDAFSMIKGVEIYGGFDGSEDPGTFDLADRDFSAHETLLSGEIGDAGTTSDNSYRVVENEDNGVDETAVLDGFTITGAKGYYGSWGGGMYNNYSSPTVTNCTFSENSAQDNGGVLLLCAPTATFTNCTFRENEAVYSPGGLGNYNSSTAALINCIFIGNIEGGARNAWDSDLTLINCTFTKNEAAAGAAVSNRDGATLTVRNCIMWGDVGTSGLDADKIEIYNSDSTVDIKHSNIQNGPESWYDLSINIIDKNPQFVSDTDVHLKTDSPCIDAGSNYCVTYDDASNGAVIVETDIDGELRVFNNADGTGADDGAVVDMGADEYVDGWGEDVDTDGDGLTDYAEVYLHGTETDDPDTDGDGLTDGYEVLTHETDPLDADTDDDGLSDYDELNHPDGIHTDPLKADSDGDEFEDSFEISRGSDPTDETSVPEPMVLHVDGTASGTGAGGSWDNAFTTLQAAVDYSIAGDEIWVAAGVYTPTAWPNGGTADREMLFSLKNGVAVYGGFSGSETQRSGRAPWTWRTVLSGDIGTTDDAADNCYHVFYHPSGAGIDHTTILDGVTITGGHADGSGAHACGGGMYNGESSPLLIGCTFRGNVADDGGGLYNSVSYTDGAADTPALVNCIFTGNRTLSDGPGRGGAICNQQSDPLLLNCTLSDNAAQQGGGIYNDGSQLSLVNCILRNNTASDAGDQVHTETGQGPTFSYCNVQGSGGGWDDLGTDGGNNIDDDPGFENEPDAGADGLWGSADDDYGNLHLTYGSPCIDAGDSGAVDAAGIAVDMDNAPRVSGSSVDMGADEYLDSDGDAAPDYMDGCPDDPAKTAPGVCGCGVADTDTDGDGTPDCSDRCPHDPYKTRPGSCGCGVDDIDSDGTFDCSDNCPDDPAKSEPGSCGCGAADTDTDGDGTPDCIDECPGDPAKIAPGSCGCGAVDTDSDGDGAPDCIDECPGDPYKTAPGSCGCGVADIDSDGDGTADCSDVDTDEDGLSDDDELNVHGTDPMDPDTDGDGLSGGIEVANGLDPLTPQGPGIPVLVSPETGEIDLALSATLIVAYGENAEADAHLATRWQIALDDGFATLVLDVTTPDHLLSLPVPDLALEPETTYYWRARFTGTDGLDRTWSAIGTFTTASDDRGDADGNGLPDDQELAEEETVDIVPAVETGWRDDLSRLSLTDANGDAFRAGLRLADDDAELLFFKNTPLSAIDDAPPTDLDMGLFGLKLRVPAAGDTALVRLYVSPLLLGEAFRLYKYDTINGWLDYSGYGAPSDDGTFVTVELVDGGYGDADGVANGIIVDPLGTRTTVGADAEAPDDGDDGDDADDGDTGDDSGSDIGDDDIPAASSGGGGGGCFISSVLR